MTLLITSDLHLTDAPRDAYRFDLFPWLAKQQIIHKVKGTFILGDLTNEKDRHSSVLVNKLVDGLKKLKPPIYILKGNHDYIREDLPFFQFLNAIEGIKFCTEPAFIEDLQVAMIPHQTSQTAFDTSCRMIPENWIVMCHQTFDGAIGESNSRLTGFSTSLISQKRPRWSYAGDIHKPQQCGLVMYVGAPYHVRHGDNYKPRVILQHDECDRDLYFDAPKKLSLTIRDLSEMPELKKGDQVKVTLELPRSEAVEWANHKKSILDYCKGKGVEVYGTALKVAQARKRQRLDDTPTNRSNLDYFKAFCAAEQVPSNIKVVGLQLVESGGSNG